MQPEEIQKHIDEGTFFDLLMEEVKMISSRGPNNEVKIELKFPVWYTLYITEESREQIEALIRENAKKKAVGSLS